MHRAPRPDPARRSSSPLPTYYLLPTGALPVPPRGVRAVYAHYLPIQHLQNAPRPPPDYD